MYTYLASPIDFAADPNGAEFIRATLIEDGHKVYAPYRAWGVKSDLDSRLQMLNMQVLEQCDALVAHLPSGTTTVGTVLELQWAVDRGMPVGVVTDLPIHRSASLLWLREQPTVTVSNDPGVVSRALMYTRPVTGKIARWTGDGQQPKIGKPGDAGFDLYYCDDQPVTIQPGDFVNVRSKISVELPAGTWGLIVGRSSAFKRRLFVAPSVIDNGYRGELFACCWNIGSEPQTIEVGDRVAQLVPFPLTAEGMTWSKGQLSDTVRGTTGFGSTGR